VDDALGSIISTLVTKYGLPGLIIAALGYGYTRLQKRLHEEQNARIEDAKLYAKELLAVNDKVHQSADRLADTLELIQRSRLYSSPDLSHHVRSLEDGRNEDK